MMKEEKIEKAARKPVEIQKETGIELPDEALASAAGGERWWEWGNAPVKHVPSTSNEPKGEG